MHPFDLKAVLLEKHAQHVAIIHFPIALLLVSFLFDLLALWRQSPALAAAARYNLFGATVSALFAVGTGLAAWQWLLNGVALTGVLWLHVSFALGSFVMLIGLSFWRRTFPDHGQLMGWRYLLLAFIACVLISFTGHMGGFVSGLNVAFNPTERIKGKTIIRVHPDCLHEGSIHAPKESLYVEHDYADRFLSHA